MLDGTGDGKSPATLCVAITDDKASERVVTAVVKELCVWQPSGVLAQLHLVHVAFCPAEFLDRFRQDVKDFMEKRFLTTLEQLPEQLDWQLHIVALNQTTWAGEPVRKARSVEDKRTLASALCREAEKIGATELVVSAKGEQFHATIAQKVVKYSKIKVRVVGSHGPKVFEGKGKQAKVPLYADGADDEPGEPRPKFPEDHTDVWSRFKAVKRGFNKLFLRRGSSGKDSFDPV